MCVAVVCLFAWVFWFQNKTGLRCRCPGLLFESFHIPIAFSIGMLNLMNERPDVPGTSAWVEKGICDSTPVPFKSINKLQFTLTLQNYHPLNISLT